MFAAHIDINEQKGMDTAQCILKGLSGDFSVSFHFFWAFFVQYFIFITDFILMFQQESES